MIWWEAANCINDCYFCMMKIIGFNAKNKHLIRYPNIPSAIRPVAHSWEVPTLSTSFTSKDKDQNTKPDFYLPFFHTQEQELLV